MNILIKGQALPLLFTPGPWSNAQHGHITSRTTGKIVATVIDNQTSMLDFALQRYPHLNANTTMLIALAPTLLMLLSDLLAIFDATRATNLFYLSDDLRHKIDITMMQAVGAQVSDQDALDVNKFMHQVAIDQSLMVDHLRGPWHLFGPHHIRAANYCVAKVASDRSDKLLWAADGNAGHAAANQKLIAMTLPLAVSLMLIMQKLDTTRLDQIDPDYLPLIQKASGVNHAITAPPFHYLQQAA